MLKRYKNNSLVKFVVAKHFQISVMDGATVEHSDSDSGESWTLLENSPTYGDEAPDSEDAANQGARDHVDFHNEKDEDTDGISIISDSEPESAPCEVNYVKIPTEETSVEQQIITPLASPPTNNNHNIESIKEETDYLGDNVKLKTYVHKRNPKVGSILDVIMLGTFVITAGMALGHLWSCKNECTTQTSVNKILSNLYKLQEENAFLRSKLKEITEATSIQLSQRKSINNKSNKQYRCKKIFEEPIINDKQQTSIKCVDDNKPDVNLHNSITMPEHEKEFLKDINKMKDIYEQNKDWLDKEVERQYDDFEKSANKQNLQLNFAKQLGPINIPLIDRNAPDVKIDANVKTHKQINLEKQLGSTYYNIPVNKKSDIPDDTTIDSSEIKRGETNTLNLNTVQSEPEKKITYADSLKIDQPLHRSKRSDSEPNKLIKSHTGKRKRSNDDILLNLDTFSEDDIKKDDRYTGHKQKYDKKKHDRQKLHKRQKRNNKYEQWEMKGGYLKDFDEFSVTSSQDNISLNKPEKKFLNVDFENYVNKLLIGSDENIPKITKKNDEKLNKSEKRILKNEKRKGKAKDFDWFDQRSALRAEARSKLEQELFGENTSNNAAWYFRRMQKREQCRAKKENSTFKKFSKRKMNFKMKR